MSDIVPALITGGLGAAVGSIGTALIQTLSGRSVSRAEAADRVTNAAGNLADRLDKFNTRLEHENNELRTALGALVDAVEKILPLVPDEMREDVRHALGKARIPFR